jgi:hypothetical protein
VCVVDRDIDVPSPPWENLEPYTSTTPEAYREIRPSRRDDRGDRDYWGSAVDDRGTRGSYCSELPTDARGTSALFSASKACGRFDRSCVPKVGG